MQPAQSRLGRKARDRFMAAADPTSTSATGEPAAIAAPTQPAIEIDALSLWYGSARALHDVSLPVAEKRITALIGPSGCGKSTLLRCINRMNDLVDGVRVTGAVRFEKKNVYDQDVDVTT